MVVAVAAVGVHAHDLVWWGLYGILRCRWMLHIVRRLPVLHTSTESAERLELQIVPCANNPRPSFYGADEPIALRVLWRT